MENECEGGVCDAEDMADFVSSLGHELEDILEQASQSHWDYLHDLGGKKTKTR